MYLALQSGCRFSNITNSFLAIVYNKSKQQTIITNNVGNRNNQQCKIGVKYDGAFNN